MRKKAIIIGAVVAVLLLTGIVFITTRPSPPPITVRHVKSVHSRGLVTATFEITNRTTSPYVIYPVSVEVSNGLGWKKCFDFDPFPGPILNPNSCESWAFDMTNLPTSSPLRLRMRAGEELAALGLFVRLDLRFRHGNKTIPLNPFDKKTGVFAKPIPILSDEFVEHEPNPVGKKASDK